MGGSGSFASGMIVVLLLAPALAAAKSKSKDESRPSDESKDGISTSDSEEAADSSDAESGDAEAESEEAGAVSDSPPGKGAGAGEGSVAVSTSGSSPARSSTSKSDGELAPREAQQKERGFYLRASVGGGHGWTHAEETTLLVDLAVTSVGPAVVLRPGYEVLPGLAVHADLLCALHFAYRLAPETESIVFEKKKVGFIGSTVGVGVSYHSLPDDLFVSAGAGVSLAYGSEWFDVVGGRALTQPDFSGPGFAAQGAIGRLFSLHPRWSVGAELDYAYQSFHRGEVTLTLTRSHSVWLTLSANFHPKRS